MSEAHELKPSIKRRDWALEESRGVQKPVCYGEVRTQGEAQPIDLFERASSDNDGRGLRKGDAHQCSNVRSRSTSRCDEQRPARRGVPSVAIYTSSSSVTTANSESMSPCSAKSSAPSSPTSPIEPASASPKRWSLMKFFSIKKRRRSKSDVSPLPAQIPRFPQQRILQQATAHIEREDERRRIHAERSQLNARRQELFAQDRAEADFGTAISGVFIRSAAHQQHLEAQRQKKLQDDREAAEKFLQKVRESQEASIAGEERGQVTRRLQADDEHLRVKIKQWLDDLVGIPRRGFRRGST